MQVKPRFDSYKILEQYPIVKDDTGNEMCLTLMEVKLPSCNHELIISTYKYWVVVGRNQDVYNNKAVGFSSVAFWKSKERNLIKTTINGIEIEEVQDGLHFVFSNTFTPKESEIGCRTTFNFKQKE